MPPLKGALKPQRYYLDPAQLLAACQHVTRSTHGSTETLLRHIHKEIQYTIAMTDWSIVKSHLLQGEGFHINLDLDVIPGLEAEAEIFVEVFVDPAMFSREPFKTYYMLPSKPGLKVLQGGRCAKKGG